jgi:hypothetical protein
METMQAEAIIKSPQRGKRREPGVTKPGSKVMKKIGPEAARLLEQIKEKVNKKTFGRTIKSSEVIALALKHINDDHIRELQQLTYREKDKLLMAHDEYQRAHGKITIDQFIGKLLSGEAGLPRQGDQLSI